MPGNGNTLEVLGEGSFSRGEVPTSTDGRASRPTDDRRILPLPPLPEDACVLRRIACARYAGGMYLRTSRFFGGM